jgi:PAS domain S-box-containing protein
MFEVERSLEPDVTLVCKLDKDGKIKFINKAYQDVTGFSEKDLVGESNEVIQHPKMPRVILEKAWDAIRQRKQMYLISKNVTKNGEYFWKIADIHSRIGQGKATAIFVRRKYLPYNIKTEFEKLYEVLYGIESSGAGLETSKKYLKGWLEERGGNYQNYIIKLFEGESNLKQYMTTEVSDKELFSTDPSDMDINDILKFVKKKKKRRFW